MKIHSIIDSTQLEICPRLAVTEFMITQVLDSISGGGASCEITMLEDLGISNNPVRMFGGFYTGMYVEWKPNISFVPVDATVNACGVSIYRLESVISFSDFFNRVQQAEERMLLDGIECNFNVGNHFISLCNDEANNQYLVIHASDNKYKYGLKGLYPSNDTWYCSSIQIYKFMNRTLRYIVGKEAERFYEYYLEAEKNNPHRNDIMADYIAGDLSCKRWIYTQHYGMPSQNSIAIGCQWNKGTKILLTSNGKDIFIVDNMDEFSSHMFPHGFGVKVKGDCKSIDYKEGCLMINSIRVDNDNGLLKTSLVKNRFADSKIDGDFIKHFLNKRSFSISKQLKQRFSYSRNGFENFEESKEMI